MKDCLASYIKTSYILNNLCKDYSLLCCDMHNHAQGLPTFQRNLLFPHWYHEDKGSSSKMILTTCKTTWCHNPVKS